MSSVHLLVLIHGMWGNPDHLAELARIARETYDTPKDGTELRVLVAETNRDDSTYDGIDWGGERVAQEILEEIEKVEQQGQKVTKFSVTGYSLGGLVARYVIGILHQRKFFDKITPVNFNTIATPHIGLPRYPSFLSSLTTSLGPKLLSRTGEQFYCVDKWSPSGRPLLLVMADPDRIFYQAWCLFPNTAIYANTICDTTVPYVTAAIELEDPFLNEGTNGIEIELDKEYPTLIKSWSLPPYPPAPTPKPRVFSRQWFKGRKNSKPILPPFLQYRFPFNLLVYASLPILIPTVITLILVRLTLASRSSRARIKLLEAEESNSERLIHAVAQLEHDVEDAVADFIDGTSPLSPSNETSAKSKESTKSEKPILSPQQKQAVAWLNTIPKLRKELVYITDLRNTHATIVCRDVNRFEVHRRGEPVLRHWAQGFIL